ncbi:MAG: hypothetical protein A2138_14085 [Deltaproteobacteria bacterium RBG_16_71_12]|nr:MAG: hypothetical protein A2138_14085 [Deltaproteobacteria bacterium RBG_16_71_12]
MLEAIAGIVAHSGDVSLGPVPLDREARQPHVHYVPARSRAFDDATVAHMLAFVAASVRAHPGAVGDVVPKLTLGDLGDRRLRTLVAGERKRAQLAAALLVPSGTLLIDEPFAGLEVRAARAVADIFRTATNERRTLLLALSSPSSDEKLCDRFTLLSNGRVVGRGQIHELREAARAHPGASLDEVMHALA